MQSDFKPPSPAVSSAIYPAISLEAEFRATLKRDRQGHKQPKRWFHYLIEFLTGQSEPSIRKKQTADGSVQWIVYDPQSNQRSVFDSEQAVRVWLEQRHLFVGAYDDR